MRGCHRTRPLFGYPKGRRAEDGPLPEKYRLQEMRTASYPARTEKNVLDSDGTLIVSHETLTGGSLRTSELAKRHRRPWLHIDLGKVSVEMAADQVRGWIEGNGIKVLNVAGARASKDPRIYAKTYDLLTALLGKKGD